MTYYITREIGIDAGHRIPTHGSKCKNVHGHRYTIEAHCVCKDLIDSGEQTGMGLDFGFLKEEMMSEIDFYCDHGFIMWLEDELLTVFLGKLGRSIEVRNHVDRGGNFMPFLIGEGDTLVGKLYVVPFIPTAENLAKHWFERLAPKVYHRSEKQAQLAKIVVHETPNCSATYEPNLIESVL